MIRFNRSQPEIIPAEHGLTTVPIFVSRQKCSRQFFSFGLPNPVRNEPFQAEESTGSDQR